MPVPDGYEFALCLTHDVDRPYKTLQAPYHAVADQSLHHLEALLPGRNPWWQFDRIIDIEDELGVKSALYFLQEQHLLFDRSPREWIQPAYWIEHLGRYDVTDTRIANVIRRLHERGWEIGVHGSLGTHLDGNRLRTEKETLERILEAPIEGIRQHWLRLERPDTWRRHAELGFAYDTTLGSTEEVGFLHGYQPLRPFNDDFLVFPVTVMDKVLARHTDGFHEALDRCQALLKEADQNDAVMTVLWHPRNFCEEDYPGQATVYQRLIEYALDMGAWVGPPRELYQHHVDDHSIIGSRSPSTVE